MKKTKTLYQDDTEPSKYSNEESTLYNLQPNRKTWGIELKLNE